MSLKIVDLLMRGFVGTHKLTGHSQGITLYGK